MTTHFAKEFKNLKKPAKIVFVSSGPSNKKQCGLYFKEFVDLINKNTNVISELVIIDATYLQRHYFKKYESTEEKSLFAWKNGHTKFIDQLNVKHSNKSWYDIRNSEGYKKWEKKIHDSFYGIDGKKETRDEQFYSCAQKVIDEFVKKKGKKIDKQMAEKYLLEDCIGALALGDIYPDACLTYPSKLNEAIDYLFSKYENDIKLTFIPYRLDEGKIKKKQDRINLIQASSDNSKNGLLFNFIQPIFSCMHNLSPEEKTSFVTSLGLGLGIGMALLVKTTDP